jgi:hypothetical protein
MEMKLAFYRKIKRKTSLLNLGLYCLCKMCLG